MIVRMSKVEIVGPKGRLMETLTLLRERGVFQIEPEIEELAEGGYWGRVRALAPDEKALSERLFFQDLRDRIEELLSYLPKVDVRRGYLEPLSVIDIFPPLVEKHLAACRERHLAKESRLKELAEFGGYSDLLGALEPLLEGVDRETGLELVGVTIRAPELVGRLRELAEQITEGRFQMETARSENGTVVGLIATEKGFADTIRSALQAEQVPEMTFPAGFAELPFAQKAAALRAQFAEVAEQVAVLEGELEGFARRWLPMYRRVREWLEERLALLQVTASVFETEMCFFCHGWVPSAEAAALRQVLAERFGGEVHLAVKKILERDLERVPVALKNPAYFRPFELFARLLPLPSYTSYDPTPFLGIFFPLFFGMILGDIGYGVLLLLAALILIRLCRARTLVSDGAKILGVSALYCILFGILFGECFGDLGHRLFGLQPLCFERSAAIVPMIYFTLSVGVMHVCLGLLIGAFSALKRRLRGEALFRLLSLVIVLCAVVLLVGVIAPLPWQVNRPLLATVLVAAPLLVLAKGLLAPLELLKIFGNIISYVRIMAIGLTSVLLAQVANRLGGMTGDIVAGILVAGLLHAFNLLLGVFAPTVHSLRLHYVEFFGKFLEFGGRRFEPLEKGPK
ncbi:V-type ATPase 116kDa subunit family protein [uncultured Desulfuromonas sp.]|uniref:V-type ATP synthase subunit I n=1 Tax=uncultured Desulfuromonas sp. TaxID=181013 RepID=UPI002617D61C|nr:V-type ATPase 116kDa subunit family protein [uncultured Desulfuromonas sp.]